MTPSGHQGFESGGATVTDALVVLGYIDAEGFLDGESPLDEEAAIAACGRKYT